MGEREAIHAAAAAVGIRSCGESWGRIVKERTSPPLSHDRPCSSHCRRTPDPLPLSHTTHTRKRDKRPQGATEKTRKMTTRRPSFGPGVGGLSLSGSLGGGGTAAANMLPMSNQFGTAERSPFVSNRLLAGLSQTLNQSARTYEPDAYPYTRAQEKTYRDVTSGVSAYATAPQQQQQQQQRGTRARRGSAGVGISPRATIGTRTLQPSGPFTQVGSVNVSPTFAASGQAAASYPSRRQSNVSAAASAQVPLESRPKLGEENLTPEQVQALLSALNFHASQTRGTSPLPPNVSPLGTPPSRGGTPLSYGGSPLASPLSPGSQRRSPYAGSANVSPTFAASNQGAASYPSRPQSNVSAAASAQVPLESLPEFGENELSPEELQNILSILNLQARQTDGTGPLSPSGSPLASPQSRGGSPFASALSPAGGAYTSPQLRSPYAGSPTGSAAGSNLGLGNLFASPTASNAYATGTLGQQASPFGVPSGASAFGTGGKIQGAYGAVGSAGRSPRRGSQAGASFAPLGLGAQSDLGALQARLQALNTAAASPAPQQQPVNFAYTSNGDSRRRRQSGGVGYAYQQQQQPVQRKTYETRQRRGSMGFGVPF